MEYVIMVVLTIVFGIIFSNNDPGDVWTIAMICVLVLLFIERKVRIKYRCKNCKKNWSLKKISTKLADKETISVLKETKNRNRNGEVIGTSEQYVPATRYIYQDTYQCKRCGSNEVRIRTKDNA